MNKEASIRFHFRLLSYHCRKANEMRRARAFKNSVPRTPFYVRVSFSRWKSRKCESGHGQVFGWLQLFIGDCRRIITEFISRGNILDKCILSRRPSSEDEINLESLIPCCSNVIYFTFMEDNLAKFRPGSLLHLNFFDIFIDFQKRMRGGF